MIDPIADLILEVESATYVKDGQRVFGLVSGSPVCSVKQLEAAKASALSLAEQSFLLDLLKHEREDIFFKVQSLKVAGRAFAQLSEQEAAGLVDGLISKLRTP